MASRHFRNIIVIGLSLNLSFVVAHAGTPHIADAIGDSRAAVVSLNQVISEMSKAQLVSVGETHAGGLERELVKEFYLKMASALKTKPNCLVETFENLFPENDVARGPFVDICQSVTSVLGNGPAGTTFARPMERAFDKGLVFTHSGFRHIMPMSIYFPGDFVGAPVDQLPANTISTQIPSPLAKKIKMASLTFLNVDEFLVFALRGEITSILAKKARLKFTSENEQNQFISNALAKLDLWMTNAYQKIQSQYSDGSSVHYFKLRELQSKAKPNRISFLGAYTEGTYKPAVMSQLLRSKEMVQFIRISNPAAPIYVHLAKANESFAGEPLGSSGILVFNSGAHLVSQPTGEIDLRQE